MIRQHQLFAFERADRLPIGIGRLQRTRRKNDADF